MNLLGKLHIQNCFRFGSHPSRTENYREGDMESDISWLGETQYIPDEDNEIMGRIG